jgi:hypothetical protein
MKPAKMHAIFASIPGWSNFFVLVGTASATLLGLMFVAVSITAGYMTEELRPGLHTFLSPTIFHFGTVLITCLVLSLPAGTEATGILLVVIGALGSAYAAWVLQRVEFVFADGLDGEDHVFYGFLPVLGQLLVLCAGVLLLRQAAPAIWVLAAALIVLLATSIHNAWDITVWAVVRRTSQK